MAVTRGDGDIRPGGLQSGDDGRPGGAGRSGTGTGSGDAGRSAAGAGPGGSGRPGGGWRNRLARKLMFPVTVAGCVCMAAALLAMLAKGTVKSWAFGGPLMAALVLTAAGVALDWDSFRSSLSSRRMLAPFMVMLNALLGAAMAAIAGYFFGARYFAILDLTRMKELTLSPQSLGLLTRLKDIEPVEVILVKGPDTPGGAREAHLDRVRRLMEVYEAEAAAASPGRLSFRTLDMVREPAAAKELLARLDLSETPEEIYDGLVFLSGDRKRYVQAGSMYGPGAYGADGRPRSRVFRGEDAVSSALAALVQGDRRVVYSIVGHGERTSEGGPRGNKALIGLLERRNFEVRQIHLVDRTSIPEDASFVLIHGPRSAWLPEEIGRLESYLNSGGKALIFLDPLAPGEAEAASGVEGLLAEYGLAVRRELRVIAVHRTMTGRTKVSLRIPAKPLPGASPVADAMSRVRSICAAEGACALDKAPAPKRAGYEIRPILLSPPYETEEFMTWAESEPVERGEPSFDEKRDVKGPLMLAAEIVRSPGEKAGGGEKPAAHMIVVADSDMAANSLLEPFRGNRDLLLAAVQALHGGEKPLGIEPRPMDSRDARVEDEDLRGLLVIFAVALPGLALTSGAVVWYARRR
ncbi:MAG: GldG family protein [Planctomycetota bacterium]|nr:GldG family protein [Planctomycetota bacterium]